MWHYPQLKVWFLLLLACSAGDGHVLSIDEILETNQYLLVTQQDGFTLAESDVPRGECPQSFLKPKTSVLEHQQKFNYVGVHLVRDSFERLPPKIMVVRKQYNDLNINIFSINATNLFNSPRKLAIFVDSTDVIDSRKLKTRYEAIKNSLFDSTNRMLYLDFSTDKTLFVEQYYIHGLFEAEVTVQFVTQFARTSPVYRFNWTEDHYAGKFYYQENVDDKIALFEIPMGAIGPTLLEGESGKEFGRLFTAGSLTSATGGAFFSTQNVESDEGWIWTTSLVPANLGAGIQCRTTVAQLPKSYKMTVIRDHDFCMLRDGPGYSRDSCDAERIEYLTSQGMLTEPNQAVKWLLVTCIVLFMLVVLLFVYIYWLRSTFIAEDDRTNQLEYETEASLFVAKQRSFPSAYQDPALLDVSVDRWN